MPRSEGGLGGVHFPVVADLNKQVARDYDVLLPDEGVVLRGLFLIDKDGIVQHQIVITCRWAETWKKHCG